MQVNVFCISVDGNTWGLATTGALRANILRAFASALERRKDEFVRLETMDCGKPHREAQADLGDCLEVCRVSLLTYTCVPSRMNNVQMYADYATELDNRQGRSIAVSNPGFTTSVVYEPKGVVACITPWNYPLLMALQKCVR
jgi:betaine-aldehyde dehydrogenase